MNTQLTPADRARGLRVIATEGHLWPEAIEELLEAANLLDAMTPTTSEVRG